MALSIRIAILALFCTVAIWAEARGERAVGGGDWPCWRGPSGNNISDSNPPIEWSATKNILWKANVPGRGHASPCVVGDKIFLASADESSETQFLLCYNRADGRPLWRADLHHRTLPTIHSNNSHASATPACDGTAVYTVFASGGALTVSAVSVDGKIMWQQQAGEYRHANGYGASPVLFRHMVIVANDNQADPSLAAFDRADGHVVWRAARPNSDNSAAPIVGVVAGRAQLLINGAKMAASYDPATGEEIWHVAHGTEVAACTMNFDDARVFASGNVPEKNFMCVRADGHGDVSDTHVLWKTDQLITYVPSPLAFDRYLFASTDSGLAWCREAATGRAVWKQRLPGTFFSSPVLASGKIMATNDAGVTYVFRAAPHYERLAENDIGEACMATPAICRDRIYLRSAAHLFCIGEAK